MTTSTLPKTPAQAEALYKKAGKVLGNPKKRIWVVGITKAENAQLGLLLKYIFTNDNVYQSMRQAEVFPYPEAFKKLCARYSWRLLITSSKLTYIMLY